MSVASAGCLIILVFPTPGLPRQVVWPRLFWFAALCGPLRLDFYCALDAFRVVAEAGPVPLFRFLHQAALDRVAMHVAEFLCRLVFIVYIES